MQQNTINQRLKFLIESLSTSVRAFSEHIGESTGNTNNYIGSRQLAPKHEYLAKVIKHYSTVNAHWLLTGEGLPFIEGADDANSVSIKNTKGQVIGVNHGTATYQTLADCEKDLKVAQEKIEQLKEQLAAKEALLAAKDDLIAAKEEMLSLLRGGHNRPN